ncbi:MAG: glutamine-hydrolyzing GMP synthase, partial [Acidimicrobiia bacterium]
MGRRRGVPDGLETILVVDFGAQYAKLIARRVREAHVYSEVVPFDMPVSEMLARGPRGVILSGGPRSVHLDGAPRVDPELFAAGVPVLGICYGAQLLAHELGGEVRRAGSGEYGRTRLSVTGSSPLFARLAAEEDVWMSHGDAVASAPPGFSVTALSAGGLVAGLEDRSRGLFGVQFHPEVVHTPRGMEVLKAFLYEICGCRPAWTRVSIVEGALVSIRSAVGS